MIGSIWEYAHLASAYFAAAYVIMAGTALVVAIIRPRLLGLTVGAVGFAGVVVYLGVIDGALLHSVSGHWIIIAALAVITFGVHLYMLSSLVLISTATRAERWISASLRVYAAACAIGFVAAISSAFTGVIERVPGISFIVAFETMLAHGWFGAIFEGAAILLACVLMVSYFSAVLTLPGVLIGIVLAPAALGGWLYEKAVKRRRSQAPVIVDIAAVPPSSGERVSSNTAQEPEHARAA